MREKFDIEIETILRPRAEYDSKEYVQTGLPSAPAIMIDDKVIVQGTDISENELEAVIRTHLGLES